MSGGRSFRFSELMTADALRLLNARGVDFLRDIGLDVVRGVVLDVLGGKNLRDSTEFLTRRRIAALNLATFGLYMHGSAVSSDFVELLPKLAANALSRGPVEKAERWVAQWILGLTDKAFQNVLRDDPRAIANYREKYEAALAEVITQHEIHHGALSGELEVDSKIKARINWLWLVYFMNTIGAQTLSIRGSEKSAYGKLFEKLVLGSLLTILGFRFVRSPDEARDLRRVFWLASRGERRESDATLLYEAGKGVRFDIGFIGRGNPEISLDKVTRFEREVSLGRSKWYLATIIIVDRIGRNSRISELAERVGGTIVQMSAAYWPQRLAQELERAIGFRHELTRMPQAAIEAYLRGKLTTVPLEEFVRGSSATLEEDEESE